MAINNLPSRIYFVITPYEFEVTYLDLAPMERDYIYILYHDKIQNKMFKIDTDQIGIRAILETIDGENLIKFTKCLQERIYVLKEWHAYPPTEWKLIRIGAIVDEVIQSKLPQMVEQEDIVVYNPSDTRRKRHKKGFLGKMFGWLFEEEIYDLNLEKS